ncbi:MAG: metallophosphoesterase [Ignavibacteria bacterium]|nr:metallophosphoesterase [Ignavibacteria bacterium]
MQRMIFFTTVFTTLFILQLLVLNSFRKFFLEKNYDKKKINVIIITIILFFNIPFLITILLKIRISDIPELIKYVYVYPFYIYMGTNVFLGLIILMTKIIKLPILIVLLIIKRFKTIKEKISKFKNRKEIVKFNNSRRAFITYSGLFLAGYAFTGTGLGILNKDSYEITKQKIKFNNLPVNLKGFKILLFSDIHSGPYMNEETMNNYANIINNLNADLILIPGDITNSTVDEAISFCNSFGNLKSRYGVFATLGNHDYFSNPDQIEEIIIKNTNIRLLRNQAEILNLNDTHLCILGSEDTRDSGMGNNNIIKGYIEKTIADAITKSERLNINFDVIPKILLCHKPYVFDYISEYNIDLMLSGHTHGGQVIFASIGSSKLSIASAVSKYVGGLYTNGKSKLYISRGIGTVGLPMRVNCPPEITIITLE